MLGKTAKASVKLTPTGLKFEGVINHQTIPALMEQSLKTELSEPVLDLAGVSRIDSAGLAFLLNWGRNNLSKESKIMLSGTSEQAQQLIETMKLDSIFEYSMTQPSTAAMTAGD